MELSESIWREHDGVQDRWMWQVIEESEVNGELVERVLASGIEDTNAAAESAASAAANECAGVSQN